MIRLSLEAQADLRSIAGQIKYDNGLAAATRVLDKIASSMGRLERFPRMGRAGRIPATRELGITGLPCIIVYQPRQNEIAVYRIIHGAMLWPPHEAGQP